MSDDKALAAEPATTEAPAETTAAAATATTPEAEVHEEVDQSQKLAALGKALES